MRYGHLFRVRAPLAAVAEFHRQANSMAAITPPVIPMQMEQGPSRLDRGDQMSFTMWLGPLPVKWRAYIGQLSSGGFEDHQLEGPFRYWVHRHAFAQVDEHTTEVTDEVQAGLRWHPLWAPIGLSMWLGLPLLFAFRGWMTRRLLESGQNL
jgi:ligand-binding SRPBCC domain-containing protein